ncbi:hypothetical protein, no similarity [Maudiozyma saulgeensis]|uniref:Uncharacterized protein n=1 Tax=Maudiozyma saulgeensis TaxID=1789683 RepID=A0A1X7QX53_9SACH|nr:hypothetical protein, no similarity [Kazachstania saulgeensis]
MVGVVTAAVCLVGIPLVVGLLVALFFCMQRYRKLKKEITDDEILEEEIKKDNDSFQFDNIETWKVDLTRTVKPGDLECGNVSVKKEERQLQQNRHKDMECISRSYIPAYRKTFRNQFHELQKQHKMNSFESGFNESNSSNLTKNDKRGSIYEQILPMFEDFDPIHEEKSAQIKNRLPQKDGVDKNYILLGRSLAKQDFGSYYPRN